MMEIEESGLTFTFAEHISVTKFDDVKFYRNAYNKLPNGKGVDIIADSPDMLQLIEVKNCSGHESENLWRTRIDIRKRTSTDNGKLSSAPADLDIDSRESLDIEVSKKIASTIACLYGAWTKSGQSDAAQELSCVWEGFISPQIQTSEKQMIVVLFLEGNFDNPNSKTRSKKMIMKRLQDSINKKLSWLNCKVSVVDSATYNRRCFSVS